MEAQSLGAKGSITSRVGQLNESFHLNHVQRLTRELSVKANPLNSPRFGRTQESPPKRSDFVKRRFDLGKLCRVLLFVPTHPPRFLYIPSSGGQT
mmetsp:Transcript_18907/g.43977  ORF Transcript_18907/g.43977 Transcript_18907/m.43977 type:complete len:95 (+) Transcript_18907:543-827(+)